MLLGAVKILFGAVEMLLGAAGMLFGRLTWMQKSLFLVMALVKLTMMQTNSFSMNSFLAQITKHVPKPSKSKPGGRLGASWAAVGPKTSPRGLLDASWAALGRLLGPSWVICRRNLRQHGPNLAPKMEPRWPKNRCKNRSFF